MAEDPTRVFIPEAFRVSRDDVTTQIWMVWELIKAPLIVPLLNLGVYLCLLMSLMLLAERLYMGIVIVLVKLFWKKPHTRYNFQPLIDDEELAGSNFPVVLIQIPMFNEREVGTLASSSIPLPSLFVCLSLLIWF